MIWDLKSQRSNARTSAAAARHQVLIWIGAAMARSPLRRFWAQILWDHEMATKTFKKQ